VDQRFRVRPFVKDTQDLLIALLARLFFRRLLFSRDIDRFLRAFYNFPQKGFFPAKFLKNSPPGGDIIIHAVRIFLVKEGANYFGGGLPSFIIMVVICTM